MEMRDDVIQQKQKQYAAPESDHGRGEGETPHPGGLFNGRDQQASHGSGYHDTCGEAGQSTLQRFAQCFFQKEYARGSQCGSEKRY